MSSKSIQDKIKKGLARAIGKTGSSVSDLVYLKKTTVTAGTPLSPGVSSTKLILLPNATFKEYDASLFDGMMQKGDRVLVSDSTVAILQNDKIQQGSNIYNVEAIDIKAPTSDVLAYICQVRLQ